MDTTLIQDVQRLLLSKKISLPGDYLAEKLMRHPDYPSALSVSEVLNDLGLDSVVVKIEKHLLDQVPFPVLAHVKTNGGEFVLIENLKKLGKLRKSLEEIWDGILLGVEAPDGWTHQEKVPTLGNQSRVSAFNKYIVVTSAAFVFAYALLDFSLAFFMTMLVTSLGMILSWSSVCNELGISNKVSEQFCSSLTACRSSNKKQIKRILGFSFSDLAMQWFLISFSTLVIMKINVLTSLSSILFILSSLALFVIPISLYTQWRIKKEWCPLCLTITACVIGQFSILFVGSLFNGLSLPKINELIFFAILCLGIVLAWHSYRSIRKKQLSESMEKNNAYKLYFNKEIFDRLLKESAPIDVAPWESETQLGNKDAALQITVVSNPFCEPCAEAHKKLDELLDRHDIGLQVRFVLNAANSNDRRTIVVRQILQNVVTHQTNPIHCRQVLNTWYSNTNLVQFENYYPTQEGVDVSSALTRHEEWSTYAGINRTPTILINGYRYPEPYRIQDLHELIPLIIPLIPRS